MKGIEGNPAIRLIRLTVRPNAVSLRDMPTHSELFVANSEPVVAEGVPGLVSMDSHLALVKRAILEDAPGSNVELYRPRTRLNVGLLKLPGQLRLGDATGLIDFRKKEVARLGDRIKSRSDEFGKPIALYGHSLGGILALEAWLENPEDVGVLVTAGSPHKYPGIGISERPDTGLLHTIAGQRDVVVPRWFAAHPQEDSTETVPGGHLALVTRRPGITAIKNAVISGSYAHRVA